MASSANGRGDQRPLSEFSGDWKRFAKEAFGLDLFGKQDEIIRSIYEHKETYVRSGNGNGKTTTVAIAAVYHFGVLGYPVITTAPTFRQVDELLWGQGIRELWERSTVVLPGKLAEGKPRVKTRRTGWFMRGFSTDRPERAQGPHRDNLLIIIDEASGINAKMMSALKGWMTNPGCSLVAIGNPSSDRKSPFWVAFHERKGQVNPIHIQLGDSPYVSEEWVEARKEEWGEDSEEYLARVLGEFPSDEEDKAIPMAWAEAAVQLWEELPPVPEGGPRWLKWAWDVAGKGQDKNALLGLDDQGRVWVLGYWREKNMLVSAAKVFARLRDLPAEQRPPYLLVDVSGRGEGADCRMQELFDDPDHADVTATTKFVPVDFGGSSALPEKAERKVDELYWRTRQALNPQASPETRIALPPDYAIPADARALGLTSAELLGQLNTRAKSFNKRGRFKVQSKFGELKKLGIKSPDAADAAVMLQNEVEIVEVNLF